MRPADMLQQIEKAAAEERRTHALRDVMAKLARANGFSPTRKELDGGIDFIVEYIQHVPGLMTSMQREAERLGAQAHIIPLLTACEEYWDNGMDIIPDHLGLVGLMDDGYYVLSILQAVANQYREANGRPLLGLDMTQANQVMRQMIGEPHASILDQHIGMALAAPMMNQFFSSFQSFTFNRPFVDRDPIWGNASVDEIVNVRMGALGIV